MSLKNMFSNEFLKMYKLGTREFNKINLQYADIPQTSLKDVTIKDSKLFFVAFHDCDLSGAKFINCELIYNTFYGGRLEHTVFDKCVIDFGLLIDTILNNTKIQRSKITWTAIFNTAIGELDFTTSDKFKVFTDPSQITPKDVQDAIINLGPIIGSLDMSIRFKVKEELRRDAEHFGIKLSDIQQQKSKYDKQNANSLLNYGQHIQNLSEIVINAYNSAHPYKTKKGYETIKEYK